MRRKSSTSPSVAAALAPLLGLRSGPRPLSDCCCHSEQGAEKRRRKRRRRRRGRKGRGRRGGRGCCGRGEVERLPDQPAIRGMDIHTEDKRQNLILPEDRNRPNLANVRLGRKVQFLGFCNQWPFRQNHGTFLEYAFGSPHHSRSSL